jgi:hypothetical protein
MHDILEPILPQVPVEGITVHIARAGLSMGDAATARLLPDGRVGIYAQVRRRLLGIIPQRRPGLLGYLGPVAAQIVTPALLAGTPLRLRIVQLTPEHLAGAGQPMIEISIWGDPRLLTPFLNMPEAFLPPEAMPTPEPAAAPPEAAPPAKSARKTQ